MSEITDQRDALKTLVEGAIDAGVVWGRPRLSDLHEKWLVEVDGSPQIRAWEIGVEEPVQTVRREQNFRHRHRRWRIQGYYSILDDRDVDATYPQMMDDAMAIADAIDGDDTLDGSAFDLEEPCEVTEPEPVRLPTTGAGQICWSAAVLVTAVTIVTP